MLLSDRGGGLRRRLEAKRARWDEPGPDEAMRSEAAGWAGGLRRWRARWEKNAATSRRAALSTQSGRVDKRFPMFSLSLCASLSVSLSVPAGLATGADVSLRAACVCRCFCFGFLCCLFHKKKKEKRKKRRKKGTRVFFSVFPALVSIFPMALCVRAQSDSDHQ